jgi:hypothetical protein
MVEILDSYVNYATHDRPINQLKQKHHGWENISEKKSY